MGRRRSSRRKENVSHPQHLRLFHHNLHPRQATQHHAIRHIHRPHARRAPLRLHRDKPNREDPVIHGRRPKSHIRFQYLQKHHPTTQRRTTKHIQLIPERLRQRSRQRLRLHLWSRHTTHILRRHKVELLKRTIIANGNLKMSIIVDNN